MKKILFILLAPSIYKHNVPPMKPRDEISFPILRP